LFFRLENSHRACAGGLGRLFLSSSAEENDAENEGEHNCERSLFRHETLLSAFTAQPS
jgi:hypothetical protein